jgi:hypothetical protein
MESPVTIPQFRIIARAVAGTLVAAIALGTAAPASAQGLFDFLFGAPRRQAPPPSASAYADPNSSVSPFGGRSEPGPRGESGPSVAFCVRLCDGRYFPIQRSSGANTAQTCSSFCPAARTKIFSGGAIDHASANDGTRYKELQNAFVYRERTVADCTCNGKDAYGLVTTEAANDPTLRAGDIVATDQGFVAYSGGGRRNAEFTPLDSYSGPIANDVKQRLAGARIVPRNATPVPETGAAAAAADRRVQLER